MSASRHINTVIIKNILLNLFCDMHNMEAISYMFNKLLTSSNQKNGIYQVSKNIKNIIKKHTKLNIESSSGDIYITDMFTSNIKFVIKIPKNINEHIGIVREYFIGLNAINKLRYLIPNFVYTFISFNCPTECNDILNIKQTSTTPFIILEHIPGDTIKTLLNNNLITFSQYINIFVQLLFALEIAQRNISFCHFDLHTSNIICRHIDNDMNYNILLDNTTYNITCRKYLPVVIDFGLSSVKYKKKNNRFERFPTIRNDELFYTRC